MDRGALLNQPETDCSIRLLGPVDLLARGEVRTVSGLRRNAILAVLALNPGQVVNMDYLIDVVWEGAVAPSTPVNTVQSHISHLRKVFGDPRVITARQPGYLLDVGEDGTDVRVAERLIEHAKSLSGPEERSNAFGDALALWRGIPLSNVQAVPLLQLQSERLQRLHRDVHRELVETRLQLGEHALLVSELEDAAEREPFDEKLHGQLMLAQYRSHRQRDALAVYQRLRDRLAEELGIDPSRELQDLFASMLRQDEWLRPPARTGQVVVRPEGRVTPSLLPPVSPFFVGRDRLFAELDRVCQPRDAAPVPGPAIALLTGTAGVGKTTAAVAWAHQVSARFPDGQLFVNLRGFDPAGTAIAPADAARVLLDALGVAPQAMPKEEPAILNLLRSTLAGKRALLVLDNARDVDQVRPLLPGPSPSMVLVTSRADLTSLIVFEGATSLTVDILTEQESVDLLRARVGHGRLMADSGTLGRLVEACAGLPLALAIVAARIQCDAHLSLPNLLEDMVERRGVLDYLSSGDAATNLRTVLSASTASLSPETRRMLRLLSLHPGATIAEPAAAALAGVDLRRGVQLLEELVRSSLLGAVAPGRYVLHDLLRAYAAEQAKRKAHKVESAGALTRLVAFYHRNACEAAIAITPNRHRIEVDVTTRVTLIAQLRYYEKAMEWFSAERETLVSLVPMAHEAGHDVAAWQLAWAMTTFLDWRGYWRDLADVHEVALAAAQALQDPLAESHALRGLAFASVATNRFADACTYFEKAFVKAGEAGDVVGTARLHLNYSNALDRFGDREEALEHARRGLQLYRDAKVDIGIAHAENAVGWTLARVGRLDEALDHCERARELLARRNDFDGGAATLDSLGFIHRRLGNLELAARRYQEAVACYRLIGDRYHEAISLESLAEVQTDLRLADAALASRQGALSIYEDLGHPRAGQIALQ